MNDFWSVFLQKVLMEAGPILAGALALWLLAQARVAWYKAKEYWPTITYKIEMAAEIAVKAAEQAGAAALIEDKKKYAIEFAAAWLAKQGLKIDVALIEGAIEAKVFDVINKPLGLPNGE